MGKKGKIGKQRRDKFYHLAKETGYRARSAFKLIQLNRKFEFLQSSRVCIDLCAAPGGWLQVASRFMPVSSIIIGVDLVPIKPIANVITLQDDITTQKCRQDIKKELKTWKADCVLNDGAPNVGSAWAHDAFTQAHLTLAALKLACDFLNKGGWFVTKVFRSKDYQPLIWVFNQLFKKVHATKPQASRNESAEIFVVCQGYKAPDKIDPKLLDWKCIFEEVNQEPTKQASLLSNKKRSRAQGYEEGDYSLFKTLAVTEFVKSAKPLDLLSSVNQIVFDDKRYLQHDLTTSEIKECCKDIKVLGKGEVRLLLNWQAMLHDLENSPAENTSAEQDKEDVAPEKTVDEMIQDLKDEETADGKRKRRKLFAMKKQARERMQIGGGATADGDDAELFSLNNIKSKKNLEKVDEGDMIEDADDDGDSSDVEDSEDSSAGDIEDNDDEEDDDDDVNPLLVDPDEETDQLTKTKLWFGKDMFQGLETVEDEDFEVEQMMKRHKKAGGVLLGDNKDTKTMTKRSDNAASQADNKSSDSDSDSDDSDYEMEQVQNETDVTTKSENGFEVVSQHYLMKNMTPEGLALGAQMAFSKKRKREIEDEAYHRWTFNDDNLPEWFTQDEAKHYQRNLPVTKEEAMEYKARLREINARPIKKIAEAKARKKQKEMKRLERARKKAEVICDNDEVTDKEKAQQLRNLYKKAGVGKRKKPEVKYVVAKKGIGKRAKRPAGVKGPFKMVDPRMKTDLRGKMKNQDKKRGKRRR
ncbi:pre-rRNA processing protein FTSJ3-like [Dendronephthya gigantea]|uniref:pre-rRNA processing protein FTSJ3-like n=1 Tax=Dendronephthya gigantea TaxID=151771 RepID=UPI00106AA79E|nr:pre-rRNA processing protein FTSJ3-like [Dendronephthya gigantea]XP_028396735.1 pre-rRNA processing protein FTSJ3-like [Dendronephthya gigantea]XP_028396736.1 pre-rRNA processing protein FTSJ3-like [Dendronephthya gigantea]XP_028396737.1 pre-rRNA processing protein FTSJ3-like [Dendronephthya gigantea]